MLARRTLSRRTVLLGGVVALPGLVAVRLAPAASTGPAAEPGFFTDDERRFLHAAIDRLIPADDVGPGALEAGVAEFIERQMDTAWAHGARWYLRPPFRQAEPQFGYQLPYAPRELYRLGIAAADRAVAARHGRPFAELDAATRDQALSAMEKGELPMPPIPSNVFFDQLLDNTREGYFADPIHGGNRDMASWRMIGFPGARGDFTDWVDRYGARYPFGPVPITDVSIGDRVL